MSSQGASFLVHAYYATFIHVSSIKPLFFLVPCQHDYWNLWRSNTTLMTLLFNRNGKCVCKRLWQIHLLYFFFHRDLEHSICTLCCWSTIGYLSDKHRGDGGTEQSHSRVNFFASNHRTYCVHMLSKGNWALTFERVFSLEFFTCTFSICISKIYFIFIRVYIASCINKEYFSMFWCSCIYLDKYITPMTQVVSNVYFLWHHEINTHFTCLKRP